MFLKELKPLKQTVRDAIPEIFVENDLRTKSHMIGEVLDTIDNELEALDLWDSELVEVTTTTTTNNHNIKIRRFTIEFDGFKVEKQSQFKINAETGSEFLIGVDFILREDREQEEAKALLTALKISSLNKGKYALSDKEREAGHYFLYHGLEVPFRAVLNSNNKIKGIVGVSFGTAEECPSKALGLCQLPDSSLCYARAGEKRATKKGNCTGCRGMDALQQGKLFSYFWDLFQESEQVRTDFINYLIDSEVETIRFNLKSDFRTVEDVATIYHLAQSGFKMVGYTARDDLTDCETISKHPFIYLNGSNRMYTNHFKCTASIEEFLNASHPCRGSCANCGNCYNLRGEVITVLVHGSGSDTVLNNDSNRWFIIESFKNNAGQSYFDWGDFDQAKGLLTCVNKTFKNLGFGDCVFKSRKDLLNYLGANL